MTTSTLSVRVARKWQEAQDICAVELVAEPGQTLPGFSAGSHIDVHLPGGLTRQYSLCNDPAEQQHYQIAVLRDPASRGGSVAVHDLVQEGQALQISAPKNHFALAHGAPRHLLLAGGIGITPLLCMAERLANTGADFALHYCARSLARTAFVQRICDASFAQRVQFHFDDGAPEQKLDMTALLAVPAVDTHLYVCGPKGFMNAVLNTARASGWPETQLHYEFFSAEVLHAADEASFEVQVASTGAVITVAPRQSVLQALAAVGVDIPFACEQGVCGTCITRVLQGVPDHKDSYLTPEEQAAGDQFMPCCSRAKTARLVLDI